MIYVSDMKISNLEKIDRFDLFATNIIILFYMSIKAIGIVYSEALGYTVCEIYLDERCIHVKERLTEESLRILLQCSGFRHLKISCS